MPSHVPLQIACILLGAFLPVRRRKTTVRDSRVNRKPVWQNEPRNTKDFNGGLFGWPRLISGGIAGERRKGKMAERTQAEKPNNFNAGVPADQPWAKMAEAPNWDNSNDFNTPCHRRVMPLDAAGAGPPITSSAPRIGGNAPDRRARTGRAGRRRCATATSAHRAISASRP